MKKPILFLFAVLSIVAAFLCGPATAGVNVNDNTDKMTHRILFSAARDSIASRSLGYCGVSAGTTTTITTANAIVYSIGGVAYSATALTNAASPVLASIPAGYKAYVVYGINAAGTVSAYRGTAVATTGTAAWPTGIPATVAVFGAVLVSNGSSAAFTPGTTAWATTDVTKTWYSLTINPGDALE